MDDSSLVGIEPVVRTTEEAFEPLRRAVRDRRAVTFGYRKPDAESITRHLQPWGLAQWHGRWYLTGYDLDRGAARVFRVGRIDTTVTASGPTGAYDIPEDHDAREMVDSTQVPTSPPRVATLRVRDGSGNALRRRAGRADGAGPTDPTASPATGGRRSRWTSATSTGWPTRWRATARRSWRSRRPTSPRPSSDGCAGWRASASPRPEEEL